MKLTDLLTKYPLAFSYRAQNYGFALFGFECRDGWAAILEPVAAYLEKLNAQEDSRVYICQIKEKFGGLRFYVNGGDDHLDKLIEEAENKSYTVCEVCGAAATMVKERGWYLTLCKDHQNPNL